jgi:hypothetical protein
LQFPVDLPVVATTSTSQRLHNLLVHSSNFSTTYSTVQRQYVQYRYIIVEIPQLPVECHHSMSAPDVLNVAF